MRALSTKSEAMELFEIDEVSSGKYTEADSPPPECFAWSTSLIKAFLESGSPSDADFWTLANKEAPVHKGSARRSQPKLESVLSDGILREMNARG